MRKIAGKFSSESPPVLNVNGDKISESWAVANTFAETFSFVSSHLFWFLEKGGHLSSVQCGFRRSRSTLDALLRLEATMCQVFACRQRFVSVFYDLEKAYDTTWRYVILRALHTIELRGHLPLFLRSFLQDRIFRVKVGTTLSSSFEQEKGVP